MATLSGISKTIKDEFTSFQNNQLKNYAIDTGTTLFFPVNPVQTHIPAGIYYPQRSRDHDFVLSKIGSDNTIVNDQESDEFLAELMWALDDESISQSANAKFVDVQRKRKVEYLGDGYFPLHEYNTELIDVHDGIIKWLNNKEFFNQSKLGFKRSILLYGETGSGKSRYIDWLSKELIQELEAIVIRVTTVNDVDLLNEHGLLTLNRVLKNRLLIIIIEELASIVSYRNGHIGLLNLLDSPLLRENVMFLSTTNNPDRIPSNIIERHSRLDVLAEICSKNNSPEFPKAFYQFVFQEALESKYEASEWYMKSMTPAALKELFIYSKIHQVSLDESYEKIKERSEIIDRNFSPAERLGF
ncbi:MAG: AAA family ATPase [Balneolaceae bacterium]|nr:AAA family ATPase [Balneolaceae bacterium]